MAVKRFFADPLVVPSGELITLESFFTENEGAVVYEISAGSAITFVAGDRRIQEPIVDGNNITTTSLQGPDGVVRIFAYEANSPAVKKFRDVNVTR